MKGASTHDRSGTYGAPLEPANTPGARVSAASWVDNSGALWLFGGNGRDHAGFTGFINDLWRYDPATANWSWMSGSSSSSHAGVYGVLGTPAAANTPGARVNAVSWKDPSGALWLFGGVGYATGGNQGSLSDLWKYDPVTGNWTWMKGASAINHSGVYGVLGTPAAANTPGARYGAATWTDASGCLWLFGGNGYDSVGTTGYLSDLWRYDPVTGNWTWMKGSPAHDQAGTYGVHATPAEANTPGGRDDAVSWIDPSGDFWLFGGNGSDAWGTTGHLNDLWKYDPMSGNWAWMRGSETANQSGSYGTRGTPSDANDPRARSMAGSWTDPSGALWLFGGSGYDEGDGNVDLSDLWKYDRVTGYWTWMRGPSAYNQYATYGTLGRTATTNMPGSRLNAASWTDPSGAFWLFGGDGYTESGADGNLSDLWKFDPVAGNWTWMKGPSVINQNGIYGTLGIPAATKTPGARQEGVSWTDPSATLWLFGGYGYDGAGTHGDLNDLWKYDWASGNWYWTKGANTVNQYGTYGVRGTPAPANTPGGRYQAVSWTDLSGALWVFGGYGYGAPGFVEGHLNDLWKYDPDSGNWAWMKGDTTVQESGIYGTFRTPAAANNPGARRFAASWTDPSGALWLFGGLGLDSAGSSHRLNDLWKYDPASGNWTWMKGASTIDQSGTYGILGSPVEGNTPGARYDAVSWTDSSGALWLFGGSGYDSAGTYGYLNDLWKYNTVSGNWTWMKGANVINQPGIYGTLGTMAVANTPGARNGATSWTDAFGALWLFGGMGYVSAGELNDLWKYDPATGNWTCMTGANTTNQSGVYGTLRTPAAGNTPGARYHAAPWTDGTGALWLFGGNGRDGAGNYGDLNDLWRIVGPDTIPPTGTVVINSNRSVTNNPNVTLSLTWSDGNGSGVSRMKFSNDSVTWSAWETLAATKAWTLAAGEGYHTVRAMFRDKAGNNSSIYSDYIRLDTVPPSGSIIINAGASSTKSRTVSLGLTWSDGTGSGVSRMRFSIDGATWTAWELLKTPRSYTLPVPLGYYTVRVQYLDAGNNYSAVYNDYIKLVTP
jgi:N-acetylneuraminic acid mutarotase